MVDGGDRRRKRITRRGPVVRAASVLASEAGAQHLLALLAALAALRLGPPEEVGEFGVAVAFGVLDVGLESKRVAQARLREPDDVVGLVLGAGDLAGLGAARHCGLLSVSRSATRIDES